MQAELRPMHMQASVWYGDRDAVSDNQDPRCGMIRRPKQLMRGVHNHWRMGREMEAELGQEGPRQGGHWTRRDGVREDEGERCRMGDGLGV